MLAHALWPTRDSPNSYVTFLLTFLQTVLRHPEGLAMFECTIPWVDFATFLGRGPRVSSDYTQSEKLSTSSILPEDWAMRGMVWPGRLLEHGFWDGSEGQLMELEMLDVRHPLPETLNDLDEHDKPYCEKPGRTTLTWRGTM